MVSPKVDRRGKNDRPATGRFCETGEKIIARHDRSAVSDCSQEFLEIFSAQWPAMLLVAKHHRVVEIKNDAAIGALEQAKLDFVEANCLEKNDHIMPTRFFENAQPLAHAGTPCRNDRRFHVESGIIIQTIPQTQPRARSVTMFHYAKYFHSIGRDESLFLQLPRLPFQRLRSPSSRGALLHAAHQTC